MGLAELLKKWLETSLALTPLTADIKSASEDSLVISYSADASRCIIWSPANGIAFSAPALCVPCHELGDLSYEGGRYLWRVEQTDTWVLPGKFGATGFTQLVSAFGSGSWTATDSIVTRSYCCDFSRIETPQRDSLKAFFDERSRFANGAVWSDR
jgi:hypothetical protein